MQTIAYIGFLTWFQGLGFRLEWLQAGGICASFTVILSRLAVNMSHTLNSLKG